MSNLPPSILPSNATTSTTATKRSSSRQLLSERLKSVKKIRSLHKQKVVSVERACEKSPRGRREKQEPRAIRMQARNRNKAIMLKVKQGGREEEDKEEWGLGLSSRLDRSFKGRADVLERVELHLEVLNLLPTYAKQFDSLY